MPKQTYVIKAFHGGLNDNFDPRDLDDTESAGLTDADIGNIGKISLTGSWVDHSILTDAGNAPGWNNTTFNTSNDNGLFYWAADYHVMDANGVFETRTSEHIGPVQLVAAYDALATPSARIFQKEGTTYDWGTLVTAGASLELSTSSGLIGTGIPCFYAVDGNLRASEMVDPATSDPQWLGYVPPQLFGGLGASYSEESASVYRTGVDSDSPANYGGWFKRSRDITAVMPEVNHKLVNETNPTTFAKNAIMVNPLSDNVGDVTGTNATDGFSFLNATVDTGYHPDGITPKGETHMAWGAALSFQEDGDGDNTGTWNTKAATRYKFYITSVYDGVQESLPQLFQHYDTSSIKEGTAEDYLNVEAKSEIQFVDGEVAGGTSHPAGGDLTSGTAVGFLPVFKLNGVFKIDSTTRATKNIWGASDVQASGSELINNLNDREFQSSYGNWDAYDAGGSNACVRAHDGSGDMLTFTSTVDTEAEGVTLDTAGMDTVDNSMKYKVTCTLQTNGGTPYMYAAVNGGGGSKFYPVDPDLSGAGSNGTISTTAMQYEAHPLAGSSSAELRIYTSGESTGRVVSIDNVSLKQWTAGSGNPRVTGARIYYSESTEGHSTLWQMFDCDFARGVKPIGSGAYGAVNADGFVPWTSYKCTPDDDNYNYIKPFVDNANFVDPPKYISYDMINEHSHAEPFNALFKFAVQANRRIYAANVMQPDRIGGTLQHHADRVIYSPVNQFDKFPKSNQIDVSINDGQSITGLKTFADRLFVFKEKKLEIINIAKDSEYLEATYPHMGIKHNAAACETDFGIAWVNSTGCFLFDGEKVINLLEKEGRRRISADNWATNIGDANYYPIIGYHKKKRELLIINDSSDHDTNSGKMYIYNLSTGGFTFKESGIIANALTNIITDWDGIPVVRDMADDNNEILKWSDTKVTSSTFEYRSPDIDFGQPGVRKKIYKVYVSYKGDGTNAVIGYGTNGDNDTLTGQFYRANADGSSTGATSSTTPLYQSAVGTDDWISAELKPAASINNVNSFQLKISGGSAIAADFEINDITVVYRIKSVK